jgi:hypothetical protein
MNNSRNTKCAGHIERIGEQRYPNSVSARKPEDESLGRPRRRWEDINIDL